MQNHIISCHRELTDFAKDILVNHVPVCLMKYTNIIKLLENRKVTVSRYFFELVFLEFTTE